MKNFFLLTILFIFSTVSAQNITFIYELKQKAQPSPAKPEYYYLDVLGKQSVFRSEQARASDSITSIDGSTLPQKVNFSQIYAFKNLVGNVVYKSVTSPLMNDKYHIIISQKITWNILPDTMKIGDLECQKATTSYGGRTWTAWFTKSVQVQEGPYIFYGLPGLIVDIADTDLDYAFSLVSVKKSSKNNMFEIRKGKQITWEDYKKLQLNYYIDPFAEVKNRNIKYKVSDENGFPVSTNFKQMTENIQKNLRENNDPIELDQKVEFK